MTLLGMDENDIVNWGRMRMLTNFKMIKRLAALKSSDVAQPVSAKGIWSYRWCACFRTSDHWWLVLPHPKLAHRAALFRGQSPLQVARFPAA